MNHWFYYLNLHFLALFHFEHPNKGKESHHLVIPFQLPLMLYSISIWFIFNLKFVLIQCNRLFQQYVKGISTAGMQSNHGFDGQLNACWTHKMTHTEIEVIKSAGFLVSVIHGRCVLCLETIM